MEIAILVVILFLCVLLGVSEIRGFCRGRKEKGESRSGETYSDDIISTTADFFVSYEKNPTMVIADRGLASELMGIEEPDDIIKRGKYERIVSLASFRAAFEREVVVVKSEKTLPKQRAGVEPKTMSIRHVSMARREEMMELVEINQRFATLCDNLEQRIFEVGLKNPQRASELAQKCLNDYAKNRKEVIRLLGTIYDSYMSGDKARNKQGWEDLRHVARDSEWLLGEFKALPRRLEWGRAEADEKREV